jgi:hypothetical protein
MTIEERKLSIAQQLANNANSILVAQLADSMEEVDRLKAKLESEKPPPPTT